MPIAAFLGPIWTPIGLLLLLCSLISVCGLLTLYRFNQRTQTQLRQQLTQQTTENTALNTRLTLERQHFEEQKQLLMHNQQQLKNEFQQLAQQTLDEKGNHLQQTHLNSLEALLKPFRAQIEGFQHRVNHLHTESIKDQASLNLEIKKVLEIGLKMSDDATQLSQALKGNKKVLGNWGEMQLERALQLSGLISGDHYTAQAGFKDNQGKHHYPDFIIKLPDAKHIVLDSKVSLNSYTQAVNAESEAEATCALEAHIQAVRAHIHALSQKDYSHLPGMQSPHFVLMFMPIEAAYIEALKHAQDLFHEGYAKNVILVSYTTLMPILRTISNLWMLENSHRETRELSDKAGDVYNQVCSLAERLYKLGSTLGTASHQYNQTLTALVGRQGLHAKVERFRHVSSKANKKLPQLAPLQIEPEQQRLSPLLNLDQ